MGINVVVADEETESALISPEQTQSTSTVRQSGLQKEKTIYVTKEQEQKDNSQDKLKYTILVLTFVVLIVLIITVVLVIRCSIRKANQVKDTMNAQMKANQVAELADSQLQFKADESSIKDARISKFGRSSSLGKDMKEKG